MFTTWYNLKKKEIREISSSRYPVLIKYVSDILNKQVKPNYLILYFSNTTVLASNTQDLDVE